MKRNHEIAVNYAKSGWKLFPAIWAIPKGQKKKTHCPRIYWTEHSSSDPKQIESWAIQWPNCYFCVALTQSNLTVLDIDNKKGKSGSDSLFDLELDYGELPATLKVSTPSGGFHHIYTGVSSVSVDKLGRGLDTPVMIPLPGTIIDGKGEYKKLKDVSPTPVPEWIQKGAGEIKSAIKQEVESYVELDLATNVSDAVAYVTKRAPISLEGEGGDLTAFQVACRVRDYGLSEHMCWKVLDEYWNPRCEPPWDMEELQQKVRNAYNYAQDPIGKNTPKAEFTPINSELPDTANSTTPPPGMPVLTLNDLTGVPPKRDWLIEGILPAREPSIIYGDGGLGKSLLGIQIGLALAYGVKKFMKFDAPAGKKVPTLVVTCEDNKDEMHRRIYGVRKHGEYDFREEDSIPFYVAPRVGDNSHLGVQEGNVVKYGQFLGDLTAKIDELRGDSEEFLLILDTVSNVFAINENDRQIVVFCVTNIIGKLIKDHKCTVLVVAHPSKSSITSGRLDSGSTAWNNSFRNRLALVAHENANLKDHRWLMQMKSNYSRRIDPVLLVWKEGRLIEDDASEVVDSIHDENLKRLMDFIKEMCEKEVPTPPGRHHLSSPNLWTTVLKDAAGGEMLKSVKKQLLDELIKDDLVRVIKGETKRSLNGIWPVTMLDKLEGLR